MKLCFLHVHPFERVWPSTYCFHFGIEYPRLYLYPLSNHRVHPNELRILCMEDFCMYHKLSQELIMRYCHALLYRITSLVKWELFSGIMFGHGKKIYFLWFSSVKTRLSYELRDTFHCCICKENHLLYEF